MKKFKATINRSFGSNGGILAHGINDGQLSSYIMAKILIKRWKADDCQLNHWASTKFAIC